MLLVPRGRAWESGLAEAEVDGLFDDRRAVLEAVAREACVEDELDGWLAGEDAPALVIEARSRRARLFDVDLALSDNAFAMLLALARRKGAATDGKELAAAISPKASSNQTTRKTRARLLAAIASSFAAAGKKLPIAPEEIVKLDGRGVYRLGVRAIVRGS